MSVTLFCFCVAGLLSWLTYLLLSAGRYHLHMLQLNTYVNSQHWLWLRQRGRRLCRWGQLALLLPAALCLGVGLGWQLAAMAAAVLIPQLLLAVYRPGRQRAKKPLVLTPRLRRLYWTLGALLLIYGGLLCALVVCQRLPLWLYFALLWLAAALMPLWTLLANVLMGPVERHINNGFFRAAQARLRSMPGLTVIGITGSYGKTSVKMILAALLAEKYETTATPHSYNTPMGVSRVVNEQLRPTTEMFVCEMGARHRLDIEEMCRLAQPDLGVLTAIGQQHLESFGSQENIIHAKMDLLRALPAEAPAFVNGDCALITDNLAEFPNPIIRYGLSPDNDYWADQLSFDRHGSSFVLHHAEESWPLVTSLLGRANVCNIVGAVAVARYLGVEMKHISRALRQLPQVEHRLQLIDGGTYTIIDDAFNSNPAGAAAALEVLSGFRGGQRIIITPGMVELGEQEYQLNYELGKKMPAACDRIILVGPSLTRALQEGAKAAGVGEGQLFVAESLTDARRILATFLQKGDAVLYENDLPDTYNE